MGWGEAWRLCRQGCASQTVLDRPSTEWSCSITWVQHTRDLGLVDYPQSCTTGSTQASSCSAICAPPLHALTHTTPPHFPALAPLLHPTLLPHPQYSTPLFPHTPTSTPGPEQVDESQLRPSTKTVETHRTTQQESRTTATTTAGGAHGPGAGDTAAGAPGAAGEPADIYKASGDIEYDEAQVRVLSGGPLFFLFNIARRYLQGDIEYDEAQMCVGGWGVCVVLCGVYKGFSWGRRLVVEGAPSSCLHAWPYQALQKHALFTASTSPYTCRQLITNNPAPLSLCVQSPHVKEAEYEARAHMEGRTDAEILRSEGADLPHATKVGACCDSGGVCGVGRCVGEGGVGWGGGRGRGGGGANGRVGVCMGIATMWGDELLGLFARSGVRVATECLCAARTPLWAECGWAGHARSGCRC